MDQRALGGGLCVLRDAKNNCKGPTDKYEENDNHIWGSTVVIVQGVDWYSPVVKAFDCRLRC